METKKVRRTVSSSDLSALSREHIVVGAKQLRKALCAGRARRVFLAVNADPAVTGPLEEACKSNNVTCAWVKSMHDLGMACGIEVGAAAAAIVD